MREEVLAIYQRYVPGFTQAKEGHFTGQCPFCGEDGFIIGLKNSSTGETTERFLCLDCEMEGNSGDLVRALGKYQPEKEKGNKPLNPEIIDGPRFGKIVQPVFPPCDQDQGENSEEKRKRIESFSNMEILKGLVDKNLSGSQFRIALLLALNGNGLTVEQISRTTKIPLSSVYRALKGNRVFHPTSKNTYILKSENEDSQIRETKGSNHG